jgi:hypothetical protein
MKETPEQKPRVGDCGNHRCYSELSAVFHPVVQDTITYSTPRRKQTTVESLKLMVMVIIETVGAS